MTVAWEAACPVGFLAAGEMEDSAAVAEAEAVGRAKVVAARARAGAARARVVRATAVEGMVKAVEGWAPEVWVMGEED